MAAYYNEIDMFAAEWLRNLIKAGLIADGEVDTRSIALVEPSDLRRFTQCHFFAGIAGWSHALRLAGWPDDKPVWTGSCPCQPFSVAGKGKGKEDERHLWPVFHKLIAECRPPVVMGEQVAGKAGYDWFDGVASDLEREDYAARAIDIPACAVNAPHIRQRLYWIAKDMGISNSAGRDEREQAASSLGYGRPDFAGSDNCSFVADSDEQRTQISPSRQFTAVKEPGGVGHTFRDMADADDAKRRAIGSGRNDDYRQEAERDESNSNAAECNYWHDAEWLTGADGKARRAQSGVRLLVDGVPNRVGRLRGYGNAIVPPLAAEVIKAFMETEPQNSAFAE